MPNVAAVIRAEISRVARKQVREEVASLKKAAAGQRALIAALNRRIQELERGMARLSRASVRASKPEQDLETAEAPARRFRAGGLASHRKRLGLSAADFGKLVGVSGQTIYKWETGEVRPRPRQLEAIAAVRSMGRRAALARLAED